MSFRVYTYPDPYQLNKTAVWQELQNAPHFCSSSVMAQSLWDLYRKNCGSFFWAMDDLTNIVYRDWCQNIERQIAQHASVSKVLRSMRKNEDPVERVELFEAIEHNKSDLIQALRLFSELDIDSCSLHETKANPEQKIFIDLYRQIAGGSSELANCFRVTDEELYGSFNNVLLKLLDESIKSESKEKEKIKAKSDDNESAVERRDERINRLNSIKNSISILPCTTIVVHGIHQFSPLQLRLISKLDEMGLDIVFLFNYVPGHDHIYATWHRLYGLLDVPINHSDIPNIPQNLMPNRTFPVSYQLSEALSDILDAKPEVDKQKRLAWLQLAGTQHLMYQYQNPTEMANYVSKKLDAVIGEKKSIQSISEKVYSTSKDVDNLLKVYYPEYAGGRHFLHYPIGQFFMALYRLWNEQTLAIDIEFGALRECAAAGFVGNLPAAEMLELLDNAAVLFEDIKDYKHAIDRLNQYILIYKQLLQPNHPKTNELKHISIYNTNVISLKKAELLRDFVVALQNTAYTLFTKDGKPVRKFTDHFAQLATMLKEKLPSLVDGEEKGLIQELLQRFNDTVSRTTLDGTIEDLRAGLYYYLKQSEIKAPDWVVRNFVQIEGDILRSKKQSELVHPPVYHFAGLSDRLMNQRVDDLLPWPLNDYFIQTVYSPNALVFQMYYLSLTEYQNFVRYALFYGLRYNYCPVQLSYIRNMGDEEEVIYYLLRLLGIEAEAVPSDQCYVDNVATPGFERASITFSVPTHAVADFMLCPLKYYFDFANNNEIVYKSPFMIKRFYVNLLIKAAWSRWGGAKLSQEAIHKTIAEEQKLLDSYFPFLRNINDKADLNKAANNYVILNLARNGQLPKYSNEHMIVKMLFQTGIYNAAQDHNHPYQAFNQLVDIQDGAKRIRLYSAMSKVKDPALTNAVKDYLVSSTELSPVVGTWCANCPGRDICLEVYYHDKESWEES